MINRIVLGSSSPRRKEILQMLGLPFEVVVPDADEHVGAVSTPEEYVSILAERKCEAVANELLSKDESIDNTLIIACDTIVYYDGMIIGKPLDEAHAGLTLGVLSDSWHTVYSGLVLRCGDKIQTDSCATGVKFAEISESQIKEYVESGEPMGKAGSYAVQLRGSSFVERIEGDFYNIVGMPVSTFCRMLKIGFYTDVFELSKRLKGKDNDGKR